MAKLLQKKFEIGDWIILSDEGIDEIIETNDYKRKDIKKFARQVVKIIKNQGVYPENDLSVTRYKNQPGNVVVASYLFRKATPAEIKKEQLKNLFQCNVGV